MQATRAYPVILFFLAACGSKSTPDTPPPPPPPLPEPDPCVLPAETGPCKALAVRFFYDATRGACREFNYGGCQGNANNFETWSACLKACAKTPEAKALSEDSWSSGRELVACKVGGAYYPTGAANVPSPTGQACRCEAGQLTACTGVAGPCLPKTTLGTSCAQGGTADGCVALETACLPTCKKDKDCAGTGYQRCVKGQCQNVFP